MGSAESLVLGGAVGPRAFFPPVLGLVLVSPVVSAVVPSPDKLVLELSEMLAEATAALSELDAGTLERLSARAAAMTGQRGLFQRPTARAVEALQARFKVFTQVVMATGENMHALSRAAMSEEYGAEWKR